MKDRPSRAVSERAAAEGPTSLRPLRLAMWSGPRNVSTALLRSFGSRPDTFVCDEPFYAHYLLKTGAPHPGAAEVIAHQENDWRRVAEALTGPVPEGKAVYYQKHMSHHLLPGMTGDWVGRLTHAFLLRDPREMLLSLAEKLSEPRLEDTGLPQQVEIFEMVRGSTGKVPPVVDAADLLRDPRGVLALLCEAVGLEFDERMLSWAPGRRPTDGIWAKHWYHKVEESTGFEPYRLREGRLPSRLEGLHAQTLEHYQALYRFRLKP